MAKSSKGIQFVELKDMILQLNTTIKMLNETISKQQAENDNLKAELAWFRQKMFGSSSERRKDDIAGQLSLFGDSVEEVDLCQYFGQKKLKDYATFFSSSSSFC